MKRSDHSRGRPLNAHPLPGRIAMQQLLEKEAQLINSYHARKLNKSNKRLDLRYVPFMKTGDATKHANWIPCCTVLPTRGKCNQRRNSRLRTL